MVVVVAIVAAGGCGQRFGENKLLVSLAGKPMLWHSVRVFAECVDVRQVFVVVASGAEAVSRLILADFVGERVVVLPCGGRTRAESVANGLQECLDDEWVVVHDAARPCLTAAVLARLLAVGCGAALAVPVRNALKRVVAGKVSEGIDRAGVWSAQTPQMFQVNALREALRRFPDSVDEADAVQRAGGVVSIVQGEPKNIKVTYPSDKVLAEAFLLESL